MTTTPPVPPTTPGGAPGPGPGLGGLPGTPPGAPPETPPTPEGTPPSPEPASGSTPAPTCPGGATTAPDGTCVPCTTGTLVVLVKQSAVCWDTGPEGFDSVDPALEGAEVSITQAGQTAPPAQTTGPDGRATFPNINPGTWTISVSKEGFEAAPTPAPTGSVSIHNTTEVPVSIARSGLDCNRKHSALPPGINDGISIWTPMFWLISGEPWILIIRDVLWLACLALMIVGLAIGNTALGALFAAFFGYLSLIIFGMVFGIILIVAAFAMFGFVMAAAISASVLSFLGMSPVDPLSFAVVSATWAGFIYATAMGRMPAFSMRDWMVPLISMAPGAMAATIVVLLMAMGNGLVISMGILLGIVCAFISGLLGHVFVNDGKTLALIWGPQDYLLPYAGERCCVQGHRGWISHFDWQEYSYDFAISEGDPVLCSREGHIIAYKQDRTGTEMGSGNSHANYVKVKHRDGSIAEYLHGMQDGVTAVNAGLSALSTPQATNPAEASYRRVDNVHVHAGQQLCKAGNVGISMFAHIHFCVKRAPTEAPNPGPAEADSPTKFKDADVAGHEGRCYSMRFYKSDNVNRGPVRTP